MQDISQNVSNVHKMTEQPTSAVPSTSAGHQPNGFSAVPSTSAGQQPNGLSALASISTGRQRDTSAICSLNRILKARVKKIRSTGFDYSRICVEYIRAYRDLKS